MKRFSLRYSLLTFRLDLLWFPAAFWSLFAVIALFMHGTDRMVGTARGYLGCALPLIAGILAAYSVLDDSALELRFAAPVPAWQTLTERLVFVLAVQAGCAFAYQILISALGGSLSVLGGWAAIQLAWLLPCLAMTALGCAAALIGCQPTTGALLVGLIWIVELVARGWFARSAWACYLLVFMGALMPDHPALVANRMVLLLAAAVLLVSAWALLRRQERYL